MINYYIKLWYNNETNTKNIDVFEPELNLSSLALRIEHQLLKHLAKCDLS